MKSEGVQLRVRWEHKPVRRSIVVVAPECVPVVCPSHHDSGSSSPIPVFECVWGGGSSFQTHRHTVHTVQWEELVQ